MAHRFNRVLACGMLALSAASLPAPTLAASPAKSPASAASPRLEDAIAKVATWTDGKVGVAAQRIGGKDVLLLNPETTFPMASTFKIAVACAILQRVTDGQLTLDTMVEIAPSVLVPSDGISAFTPHPGVSLSIHNLLELMLTRSDNTATDVLVAQAGGPQAVTGWLRAKGIEGQRIDADTARLIYRALEITPGPGDFMSTVEAAFVADPEIRKRDLERIPNRAFDEDPRDSTTPAAMLKLLQMIQQGKALDAERTKVLLEIMTRCKTGDKRLKGLLPAGASVAHKTGTLMGIANDVGIVTLPDGGALAIAVYIKGDTKGMETQDRVIAEIARIAFDYFTINGQ